MSPRGPVAVAADVTMVGDAVHTRECAVANVDRGSLKRPRRCDAATPNDGSRADA